MMNIDVFIKDLKDLIKQHDLQARVDVEFYNISDSFYTRNDNIYDSSEYWYDDIEVDRKAWLRYHYELRDDFKLSEVPFVYDVVLAWLDDIGAPDDLEIDSLTLADLKRTFPADVNDLMAMIENEIDDVDVLDLEEYTMPLYGVEDVYADIMEALSFWTVYFEPAVWNEDIAWQCGLVPFSYRGRNYLALGGCGMDLSPRLDAYQALTARSIPSWSHFLRSPEYAKSVVGDSVYARVLDAIKCPPRIYISTDCPLDLN